MRGLKKRVVFWITFRGGMKLGLTMLIVMIIATIFSYDLSTDRTLNTWSLPLSGKIIALDAGHGGPDGGAVSPSGLVEKDVTLPISIYLRDYLQQAGAIVVMTREKDEDLAPEDLKGLSKRKTADLAKRVQLIKNNDADVLISIHLNSIPSPRWHGAQTFYPGGKGESKVLASLIQEEIIRNLENSDRTAKEINNIYLLKSMSIPSALVEIGFLSHDEEAKLLEQPKYQKQMAASIYEGILRFYAGDKVTNTP